MVEESIHIRFDYKNPDSKMSELVKRCAKLQVYEDAPKFTQEYEPVIEATEPANQFEVPDNNEIPKANPKDEYSEEEAHDDSEEAA